MDPILAELWGLQGNWGGYLGSPIAAGYFLTAAHLNVSAGQQIIFSSGPNAGSYTAIESYTSPVSDLRIWKIDGTFSSWLPLMSVAPSSEDPYVAFGRGTQRGAVYEYPESNPRGWLWGSSDSTKRWGTGSLGGVLTSEGVSYLYDAFDGPGAIQLSVGDSGGALFILHEEIWELAGIHYAVTGPYSEAVDAPSFNAALYDADGLYTVNDSHYTPASAHGAFFSTSVYSELAWINSVIVPEPPRTLLSCMAILLPLALRKIPRRQR